MSFIGIVSNRNTFQRIEKLFKEKNIEKENNINFINLNINSIKNLKNIKFETLVIAEDLKKYSNYSLTIENLINNSSYLLVNTDRNKIINYFDKKIITYGLNQKADITMSSIKDENILVCCQKNFKSKNNKLIEIHEKKLKIKNVNNTKLYDILIIYIINIIYK